MITTDLTVATMPIRLAGKEYQMSPLSDSDIGELDHWLKTKIIQTAINSIPENASDKVRQEVLDSANRVATEITWMSPEGARQMRTLDGMSRLIWQSIKKQYPGMTHADVRRMVMDPKTMSEALAALDQFSESGAVFPEK